MSGRCVEGFAAGVAVGLGGAALGCLAYFVLARTLLAQDGEERAPRDPARTSALETSRNSTFAWRE